MSCLGLLILPRAGRTALGKLSSSRILSVNLPACTQVANLTSVNSVAPLPPRPRPFTGKYNFLWQLVDSATKRFDDNSKIILIEGNVATGKNELAKKIAKEFDMLYVPDINFNEVNVDEENGIDLREWNQYFKRTLYYDRETMYSSSDPQKDQMAARAQYQIYKARYFKYCDAFHHMFNTGQGVVMARSVFSDSAFAYAMRKARLMSRGGYVHYEEILNQTRRSLYMPHLIIYLDGTIAFCRSQIKKRNIPWEVNSPVLTDEYLHSIEDTYKSEIMPLFETYCEVMTLDPAIPIDDWDFFVEQLEGLTLDPDINNPSNDNMFHDWSNNSETQWDSMRLFTGSRQRQKELFPFRIPRYAPELQVTEEELGIIRTLRSDLPYAEDKLVA